MDPLCGGTHSVHSSMSGDFSMAWRYSPIAFPVVLGAIALLARHALGLATNRSANGRGVAITRIREPMLVRMRSSAPGIRSGRDVQRVVMPPSRTGIQITIARQQTP
jgi:hypothetical protein